MHSEGSPDAGRIDRHGLLIDVRCANDPDRPRIVLTGRLDDPDAGRLQQTVIDVLRRSCPRGIDIDLAEVTFLDPSGIRALLLCQTDAQQLDCHIRLTNPRPMAYRALQLAGLLEHFGLTRPRSADPASTRMAGAAMGLLNSGLFR
jgi:anti-sigma B factor antagonist